MIVHRYFPFFSCCFALAFAWGAASARADGMVAPPEKEKKPCDKCDQDCPDKTCGDPFYLHNGEFFWTKAFLSAPHSLLELKVRYSTFATTEGVLGSGWVHGYSYRAMKTEDGGYAVRIPLRETLFFVASGGQFRGKENQQHTLTVVTGGLVMRDTESQMEHWFDDAGRLIRVVDARASRQVAITYETDGQKEVIAIPKSSKLTSPVVTVRDWRVAQVQEQLLDGSATGRFLDFGYTPTGQLELVSDQTGTRLVRFTYDLPKGQLTKITDELDQDYDFTYYDAIADQGKLYWRYMKTFSGRGCSDCTLRTNYYDDDTYDLLGARNGRLIRQTQGSNGYGEEVNVTYNGGSSTTVIYTIRNTTTGVILHTRQEVVTFTADRFGTDRVLSRAVTVVGGMDVSQAVKENSYTYNADNGRIDTQTSESGSVVTYGYDANDNITSESRTLSAGRDLVTTRTYDTQGNKTLESVYYSDTPTEIFTTEWTYDSGNRRTSEKLRKADGTYATTTFDYYTSGVNLGLLLRRTDARGNAIEYTYTTVADAPAPVGLLKREFDPANPAYQTTYAYDSWGNRISMTDALNRTTQWEYDLRGRVTKETTADLTKTIHTYTGGNLVETKVGTAAAGWRTTRFEYNGLNQRIRVARMDGATEVTQMTYEYDSDGHVLKETNALGQSVGYEYNNVGWRTKMKRPHPDLDSQTVDTTYIYDEAGRLIRETDPVGTVTETTYDLFSRVATHTEAKAQLEQRTTEYSYDTQGHSVETRYKDAAGTLKATTRKYYDRLGRLTGINWNPANASPDATGARELPSKMEYDNVGNVTASIDGLGNRTEYVYDAYSRPTAIKYADRALYTAPNDDIFTYDLVGNVVIQQDGRGTRIYTRFDAMKRPLTISVPTVATLTGNWWETPTNVARQFVYNAWGQSSATVSITGATTSTTYDALGRVLTTADAAGLVLTFTYDALDQPKEIVYPALPGYSTTTQITYSYNPRWGQLPLSVTDRGGHVTSYRYDTLYRQIATRSSLNQPSGPEQLTSYDRLSRETSRTDEAGNATQLTYDLFNQVLTTTLPEHTTVVSSIRTYTYDAYGRVLTESGAGSYPVTHTYDLAGNLKTLTTLYGSASTNQTTTWLYDLRNRVQRKTYPDTSYFAYTYDERGNLKTRRDAMNRTTTYTYNLYNQPLTIDYPTNTDVVYTYDAAGRRLSMTDGSRSGGPSTEWAYDAVGRVTLYKQHAVDRKITNLYNVENSRTSMSVDRISTPGSPWTTTYAYDNYGRLSTVQDPRVSTTAFTYNWNPLADLPSEIVMPSGAKQVKNYDALARLTEIKALNGAGTSVNRYAYTYNVAGQRQDATLLDGGKISYTYDAKRQLTGATKDTDSSYTYGYTFDEIGNWLTGHTGRIGQPPLAKTFVPNALNQYTQVSAVTHTDDLNGNLTNDGTNTYTYDEENRLLTVTGGAFGYDAIGRRVVADGVRYLYDEWNVIAELDATNTVTRTVTRGLDLSGRFQDAGGVGGILATVTTSTTGYYFYDGNGNVVTVLDGSHAAVASYTYDPFGNKVAESGSYIAQPYQWSTKQVHVPSGLLYYGLRFYNPETGRFISRDPIEEQGGHNIYAFVRNNGINAIDYLGLEPVNLRSLLKDFLTRVSGGWDGSILIAKPFLPPIGAFFQIHFYGTVVAKPCCDEREGDMDIMWEARGGLEAFLQWGGHWKWKKTGFGAAERGRPEPNAGYRDRSWHADFNARPATCPESAFELSDWALVAFIRGSVGAGVGYQASLEFTVAQTNFNPTSLWDRFNGSGSRAWGVVGASVELGLNGGVGAKGKVEVP